MSQNKYRDARVNHPSFNINIAYTPAGHPWALQDLRVLGEHTRVELPHLHVTVA